MGMYTGFRAFVTILPQYRPGLALLHVRKKPDGSWVSDPWCRVHAAFPYFPGVGIWKHFARNTFIPFGALSSMPDHFSEKGRAYSDYDPDTGRWVFCCSLKNYEDEIETFVDLVLAHIVESVSYCESLYEEDETPIKYLEPHNVRRR